MCHFEVHNTIARAVLFQDAAITPTHGLCVDVVASAKRDLKAGEILDGIGHYMTYSECENAHTAIVEALLPIRLAEGCTLKNNAPHDATLTYTDIQLPKSRLIDQLRKQQDLNFFGESHIQ